MERDGEHQWKLLWYSADSFIESNFSLVQLDEGGGVRRRREIVKNLYLSSIIWLKDWAVLQKIAEGRKRSEWMMRWEEENPIYNFKTFLPSLMELAKLIFSVTNNRSDYLYFVFGWRRKSRKISRTSHRSFLLSTKVKKRKIRLKYSFDEILLMLHLFAFMIQPRCVCVGLFEEHKANLIFFLPFASTSQRGFFRFGFAK